ncbi:VWA domain-containing protein [Lentisphaera profundi]|uniref:VWA domain-containing protein n=1 Tax=Lentisphaera profundi TaxID=1658616 RepID=A0ABY7VRX9_9BACT|nr:vWA domain-containing protein [Lentisphaera profundi]WDE96963.1 VWA domain-containing protein [Lentisphaera profundi]
MPSFSPIIPLPILAIIFVLYLWSLWALWKREQGKKPIYLIFRFIATLLIFFCALKPAWKISQTISSKQSLYILIDSSQSMEVEDELPSRYKNALSLIEKHREEIDELDRLNVEIRFFDLKLHETSPDKLGSATSISNALSTCLQEDNKIKAFMLLSDGIQNHGQDLEKVIYTIKQNETSVYFVAFGKEKLQGQFSDISLSELRSPEFIQDKQDLKIKFRAELKGLKGKNQSFELMHEGRLLTSQTYLAKSNHDIVELEMIVPEKKLKASYKLLTIKAPPRANEITPLDNEAQRLIFVREEGLKILLLATHPSADYKFLRRSLETNPHFTLTSPSPFVLQSSRADDFWKETQLDDYDLIILSQVNPKFLKPRFFNELYELYSLNKKGVLIINGSDFNKYLSQDLAFADSLPILPVGAPLEQDIIINELSQNHFISKNFKDYNLNTLAISGITFPSRANPGSQVILDSSLAPLIVTRQWKASRLGMIQTNSLWQLNLNENQEFYHDIITRLAYFLCARENDLKDSLNVKSNKLNYVQKEKVFFTASLKNAEGTQVKGADVKLTFKDQNHSMTPMALSYAHTQVFEQSGLIEFKAKSKMNEESLVSLPAQLYVNQEHNELKDISTNLQLLNTLSEQTKGAQVLRSDFSDWLKKMNRTGRVHSVSLQVKNTPLWDNYFILCLILFFFCLEWYWRKFV